MKTPPREEVILSIARELESNEDELLAMAGRVAEDLSDAIAQKPKEMAPFLRIAKDLPREEISKLTAQAEKKRVNLAKKQLPDKS